MSEPEHISTILPRTLLKLMQQWREKEKQQREQENEEILKEHIVEAKRT